MMIEDPPPVVTAHCSSILDRHYRAEMAGEANRPSASLRIDLFHSLTLASPLVWSSDGVSPMLVCPDRAEYAARICQARMEVFGEDGIPRLAQALGVPASTWMNYEQGVRIPDTIILAFVCLTEVSPLWLLRGEGTPFSPSIKPSIRSG